MNTKNLTKEQLRQLETVRSNLRRAVKHLQAPDIMGIARKIEESAIRGNSYLVKNPACCETSVNTPPAIRLENHQIGSDIVGLYTALTLIEAFLTPPEKMDLE